MKTYFRVLNFLRPFAGLFFLSHSLTSLILQTTLFTLAHSAMLGAVIFLGISIPSRWASSGSVTPPAKGSWKAGNTLRLNNSGASG